MFAKFCPSTIVFQKRRVGLTEDQKNDSVDAMLNLEHLQLSSSICHSHSIWGHVCMAIHLVNNLKNRKFVSNIWTQNCYKIKDLADIKQVFQQDCLRSSQSYAESGGEIYIRQTAMGKYSECSLLVLSTSLFNILMHSDLFNL